MTSLIYSKLPTLTKGDKNTHSGIVRLGYDITLSKARLLVPGGREHRYVVEKMMEQLYPFPL